MNRIKRYINRVKDNPRSVLNLLLLNIKDYIYENKIFLIFVLINLINAILLRILTVGGTENTFNISPILADLFFLLIIGAPGYLMKGKSRIRYYFMLTLFLSTICLINSSYYTFYTSFSSISLLSTLKYIGEVGDAVVENVLKPKDLIYLLMPIVFIYFHYNYKRNKYYKEVNFANKNKKLCLKTLLASLTVAICFAVTLTATDIGRLTKQWNREYIVMKYGIYVYHINDLIKSIEPKLVSLFGYDTSLKEFNEYFKDVPNTDTTTNEYSGIFEGKNIIAIHAESMQNFVIGLKFNGVEVTPNLNRLASNSLYFDNFYTQVSVGTSSDTEFTFNTGLMPANTGTAFGNYADKEYVSIPKLLKEKGYYSFAMHGNNGDYWNRRIMHANLGYDTLYAKNDFEIDEIIGLGLSDKSFFRQAVKKLETIAKEKEPYYGTFIMLTNHTPFSEVDKYGNFDVSLKSKVYNEETKEYEEIVYPYMEGTKLGNYLKSVHYADYALGIFLEQLEEKGLLENTVIVLYGDHDARLPISDYRRMYNYDITTDDVLSEDNPNYVEFNDYDYELNRKVPLIIYSKDREKQAKKISYTMGMYNLMPTLGNMFGFYNKYALGKDIFDVKNNNMVVFPTSNWLTDKIYYNNQKTEHYVLNNAIVSEEYIEKNCEIADKILDISNDILVFDLIKNANSSQVDETKIIKENELYE